MSEAETRSTPDAKETVLLSKWQRWLEFLQILAVLVIAAGIAMPFAFGLQVAGAWAGAAALAITGFLIAYLALGLIRKEADSTADQKYEVTATRILTLESTGVPKDVVDTLRHLRTDDLPRQWEGAETLRDDFYARIGEKRGAAYLPRILPYLAVYAPSRPGPASQKPLMNEVVRNADTNILTTDTKMSLGSEASR